MKPIWYFVGISPAIGVLVLGAGIVGLLSGEVAHGARQPPSARLVGRDHDGRWSIIPLLQQEIGGVTRPAWPSRSL